MMKKTNAPLPVMVCGRALAADRRDGAFKKAAGPSPSSFAKGGEGCPAGMEKE